MNLRQIIVSGAVALALSPAAFATTNSAERCTALEKQFDAWQEIRDDLAHGQLLDGGRDWTDVIARMLEIETLLMSATVARPHPP